MRVIAAAVVLLAGGASAQVPDGAPPEPATWVGAEARGAAVAPADAVDGVTWDLAAQGAWAPWPLLELGAGIDGRGAVFDVEDTGRGSGRAGLGVLRLWVGTGGTGSTVAGGVRAVASVGSRALGWESLDGGAPEGALSLQLDGTWAAARALELEATLDGGMIWDGPGSLTGGAQLDAFVGERDLRPFLGALVRGSPDVPPRAHLRLGLELAARPWMLTAVVTAAPPDDPEGHRLGLQLSLVLVANGTVTR